MRCMSKKQNDSIKELWKAASDHSKSHNPLGNCPHGHGRTLESAITPLQDGRNLTKEVKALTIVDRATVWSEFIAAKRFNSVYVTKLFDSE